MRKIYCILFFLACCGAAVAQKANDVDVIHKTGNETKSGNFTLTNKLILDSLKFSTQGILNLGNYNSGSKGMRFSSPIAGAALGNQLDLEMTSDGVTWKRTMSFGYSTMEIGTDISMNSSLKINGSMVPIGTNDTLGLKSQINVKANDVSVVHITGNETLAGIKTFSSSPVVPDATVSNQPAALGQLQAGLDTKADKTIMVNGQPLSANVTLAKSDVGLSNADNTSDADKPVSVANQAIFNIKADKSITINGQPLSANVTLAKADVGLANADNTSDAAKPISSATQTALDIKADKATTLAGYGITDAVLNSNVVHNIGAESIAGVKTFSESPVIPDATLTTQAASLGQVNTALGTKADKSITINGQPLSANVTLAKADVGLSNTDNTSDAAKPISSATQTALDIKADKATTLAGYGITDAVLNSNVVHNIGAESIAGVKTFSASPVIPDATLTTQAASLGQVSTSLGTKADKSITINGQPLSANVTLAKADVGLSNADNTSDVSKPVSTATLTALNMKADKATTLAGYGITDAVLNSNVVHNIGAESIAGVKTFSASPVIPDATLTTQAASLGQVSTSLGTKADKSITINGQPLSANVTLAKADVGLSNADNTSDVSKPVSTATLTALNTKADKATTLAGYGITDAPLSANVLHKSGDETVTGIKTFSGGLNATILNTLSYVNLGDKIGYNTISNAISLYAENPAGNRNKWTFVTITPGEGGSTSNYNLTMPAASGTIALIDGYGSAGTLSKWVNPYTLGNAVAGTDYLTPSGAAASFISLNGGAISGSLSATSFVKSGGTSSQFLKADGSIDATSYQTSLGFTAANNVNVVHLSGNESVSGIKTFTDKIGIGTTNPGIYQLAVKGTIRAQAIKVDPSNWADYVFEKSYKLPALSDVEKFINEKQHLPDIPSEAEVKKNGIELGDMNVLLLKKIEELTLYMIEKDKEVKELKTRLDTLEKKK